MKKSIHPNAVRRRNDKCDRGDSNPHGVTHWNLNSGSCHSYQPQQQSKCPADRLPSVNALVNRISAAFESAASWENYRAAKRLGARLSVTDQMLVVDAAIAAMRRLRATNR
jgi:hypothetical protein